MLNRLKPDFIIIGAQKAGTTSFYEYLKAHPDFRPASVKEVHYFDLNYTRPVEWYNSHFAFNWLHRNAFTGEASPYYIFHPAVAQRVHAYNPEIKLIALLRDPVKRAYSQYCMNVARGDETLSFEQALEKEAERLDGEEEKLMKDTAYYSFSHQNYSYLSRGRYVLQIKHWLKFFPFEQFMFISDLMLMQEPQQVMDAFCGFIKRKKFRISSPIKVNSFSDNNLNAQTKLHVEEHFVSYNLELKKLTGIDLCK
jgi:hypothetical protein